LHRNRFLLSPVLPVLLCFSLILSVKAETAMWTKTYDRDISLDFAYSLVETSDGGYAIVGSTNYSVVGDFDFWLVKTDAFGNVEWNQTYGGPATDVPRTLVVTSDGGYAIAGTTDSFGAGNTDFWLVKTDGIGNVEWNQTYGAPTVETVGSLVVTSDGGYALTGGWNCSAGGADFWLVKTDEYGNVEWNQTYGGADYDAASSLIVTSDGGYAIAGYTRSFGAGDRDFWLVKTDAAGNMEWNQTYGGVNADIAYSLVEISDGGYALAGTGDVANELWFETGDFWLVKTDAAGNMEWNQTYGGVNADIAYSLVVTSDGGYAIAGITNSSGSEDGNFWLVKTDGIGNVEWNQTYGGADYDLARSLIATSDGGYAVAGLTVSFGVGAGDFWLVKTDEYGVVPEAAWIILPFLLVATVSIFISKKILLRKNSKVF
jgi:hypothetical protein